MDMITTNPGATGGGPTSGAVSGVGGSGDKTSAIVDLPPPIGKRHIMEAMVELRLEVPFCNTKSSITTSTAACQITLQRGSCELWGCELAIGKTYRIPTGGCKLALFTWHGCVLDVWLVSNATTTIEDPYLCDETETNISFVNTHAQLEALRDEAAGSTNGPSSRPQHAQQDQQETTNSNDEKKQGPRVMIVGPPESGKSSLCKVLIAYACKVGRCPLWVDLDPVDNALSIPGTVSVAPMTASAITVETYATNGIPVASSSAVAVANNNASASAGGVTPTTSPLVLWHGSSSSSSTSESKPVHPELFRAQVSVLASKINQRLDGDDAARSSGIIVNTNGWMSEDDADGYPLLLEAANALGINVFLVMGQDKLYSRLTNHYHNNNNVTAGANPIPVKIIKLPRSGGVVTKPDIKQSKSRAVKRYFYGEYMVDTLSASSSSTTAGGVASTAGVGGDSSAPGGSDATGSTSAGSVSSAKVMVPQLTPFLVQIAFGDIQLYKLSSIALSASLLPVAATQSTDAIQLAQVLDLKDGGGEGLQHAVVAVAHPTAVAKYQSTQRARDLVTAGVAGFCVIERVVVDTDTLHLLSPCAGALPSNTLLLGDVTWME